MSKTSWSRNDRKLMRNEASVLECLQTFLDFACNVKYTQRRMCLQVAASQGHRSSFVQTVTCRLAATTTKIIRCPSKLRVAAFIIHKRLVNNKRKSETLNKEKQPPPVLHETERQLTSMATLGMARRYSMMSSFSVTMR